MTELSKYFSQKHLAFAADGFVVAMAISLPWSTSVAVFLSMLWWVALVPTLRWADIRHELATAAGGLPVLLVALGMLGMLWADVAPTERLKGIESFFKLLAIPQMFVQFRRSERGEWVFIGYLLSCLVLLVVTTIVMVTPWASSLLSFDNVLVKNAATQSGEFVTCIFGLLYLMSDAVERRRWWVWLGLVVIILWLAADILYASASRTALVVALVLVVLFAIKNLRAKGVGLLLTSVAVLGIIGWSSSPYLRFRTGAILTEIQTYEATNERTSSGERLEFWKKSIAFIRGAPVIGHGTGSVRALFEESSVGQTGTSAVAAANPHNQTFAVAIQLGMIGAGVLWAMWIAHALLFRGSGLANWVGVVVVVQNIVGSLFNSHLFDFTQGWVYVIGVGVAGGIMTRAMEKTSGAATGLR